tara:strand:+ start:1710 stop:2069 length:360 start_codon:yes stop_codon:yes gene_type:complete
MARITVEDCIEKVENRFDLIVLSAHRAREISAGDELTLSRDNDKNPVVSLREIAEDKVSCEDLKENLITSMQTQLIDDELLNKDDEISNIELEKEEPKSELENNLAKFNIQVQDRYEDI